MQRRYAVQALLAQRMARMGHSFEDISRLLSHLVVSVVLSHVVADRSRGSCSTVHRNVVFRCHYQSQCLISGYSALPQGDFRNGLWAQAPRHSAVPVLIETEIETETCFGGYQRLAIYDRPVLRLAWRTTALNSPGVWCRNFRVGIRVADLGRYSFPWLISRIIQGRSYWGGTGGTCPPNIFYDHGSKNMKIWSCFKIESR